MVRRICSAHRTHLLAALFLLPVAAAAQAAAPGILDAAQAGKLIPASVYFAGQTATIQARNSAGVRFADGRLTLAVLVDSSGYSTAVQQRYQDCLLTEAALDLGGKRLPAGAYGMGVVHGEFYVMDIGNHELLKIAARHDATMHRPVPLKITAGMTPGTYRLCLGRECVSFRRAK